MPICRDCNKDVAGNFQTIETRRKTKIIICNECLAKYKRKEVNSANNSSEPVRQY